MDKNIGAKFDAIAHTEKYIFLVSTKANFQKKNVDYIIEEIKNLYKFYL